MTSLEKKPFFYPFIDGLRSLAILAVLSYHSELGTHSGGVSLVISKILGTGGKGVDLFFVLSGFLITGILVRSKRKKNYLKSFFMRRVLRIFPLYYLVLFLTFFILPNFNHPNLEKWSSVEPFWYFTYLSNFYIGLRGQFSHGIVDLSWSLAIEEQFYLLWPFVVLFFSKESLKKVCLGIVLFTFLTRIILAESGYSRLFIYTFTLCRVDALVLGALASLLYEEGHEVLIFIKSHISKLLLSSILIFSTCNFLGIYNSSLRLSLSYSMVGLSFFFILIYLLKENELGDSWAIKNLEKKWPLLIGKYSYGIYLFHNPIQAAIRPFFLNALSLYSSEAWGIFVQLIFITLVTILATLLAWMSFELFEKHFIKMKKKFSVG